VHSQHGRERLRGPNQSERPLQALLSCLRLVLGVSHEGVEPVQPHARLLQERLLAEQTVRLSARDREWLLRVGHRLGEPAGCLPQSSPGLDADARHGLVVEGAGGCQVGGGPLLGGHAIHRSKGRFGVRAPGTGEPREFGSNSIKGCCRAQESFLLFGRVAHPQPGLLSDQALNLRCCVLREGACLVHDLVGDGGAQGA